MINVTIEQVAKDMLIEMYGAVLKNRISPYKWSFYKNQLIDLGVIENVESLREDLRKAYEY